MGLNRTKACEYKKTILELSGNVIYLLERLQ
jgi:hypothetical protein